MTAHIHLDLTGTSRNPLLSIAPLDMYIAVGFGDAQILKDGKVIYDGETEDDESEIKQLSEFEAIAQSDPNHNYQCFLNAPLWSARWERHDWYLFMRSGDWQVIEESDGKAGIWVCIEAGEGFA